MSQNLLEELCTQDIWTSILSTQKLSENQWKTPKMWNKSEENNSDMHSPDTLLYHIALIGFKLKVLVKTLATDNLNAFHQHPTLTSSLNGIDRVEILRSSQPIRVMWAGQFT